MKRWALVDDIRTSKGGEDHGSQGNCSPNREQQAALGVVILSESSYDRYDERHNG